MSVIFSDNEGIHIEFIKNTNWTVKKNMVRSYAGQRMQSEEAPE